MIFETFPLLRSHPVHEETIRQVNDEDSSDHLDPNSKRRDPREQSDDQPQTAKELRADDEKRHRSRESQMLKKSHGAVKTKASKPAQHFLRAVRKEHHPQDHSQHGQSHIVPRTHQLLHNLFSSLRSSREIIKPADAAYNLSLNFVEGWYRRKCPQAMVFLQMERTAMG